MVDVMPNTTHFARNRASLAAVTQTLAQKSEPSIRDAARRNGTDLTAEPVPEVVSQASRRLTDQVLRQGGVALDAAARAFRTLVAQRPPGNGFAAITAAHATDVAALQADVAHQHPQLVASRDRAERALRAFFNGLGRSVTEVKARSVSATLANAAVFVIAEICIFSLFLMDVSPSPAFAAMIGTVFSLALLLPDWLAGRLARYIRLPGPVNFGLSLLGISTFVAWTLTIALLGVAVREVALDRQDLPVALRETLFIVMSDGIADVITYDLRSWALAGFVLIAGSVTFAKSFNATYPIPGEARHRAELRAAQDDVDAHIEEADLRLDDVRMEAQDRAADLTAAIEDYARQARAIADRTAATAAAIDAAAAVTDSEAGHAIEVYRSVWEEVAGHAAQVDFSTPVQNPDLAQLCLQVNALAADAEAEAEEAARSAIAARSQQYHAEAVIDAQDVRAQSRLATILGTPEPAIPEPGDRAMAFLPGLDIT